MTALQQLIYQVATDAEFRRQLQAGAMGESLASETREAILFWGRLLELSPQELWQQLGDSLPQIGWD